MVCVGAFIVAALLPRAARVAQEPAAGGAPPATRAIPTFESLHVDAAELPNKDWRLAPEPAFASPQPATLLDGSALGAAASAVKRKEVQTIAGPSGTGSILLLEFEPKIPDGVTAILVKHLWDEAGRPTRQRPEVYARSGNLVVVLSFSLTSPIRNWTCDRMRRRFGLRLPFDSEQLRPLLAPVMRQYEAGNAEGGLQLLHAAQEKLAGVSFAAWLEGELCWGKEDWAGTEAAFARALKLDAESDPLPDDDTVRRCVDGRGTALYGLKRWDDAVAKFREAAELAADLGRTKDQAASLYNGACSLALGGKSDDALALLKQALALDDGALKRHAKSDKDFDSLKERPDYKALLE